MIREGKYYRYPQETWDEAKCKKMAGFAPADHWGNRPPKGLINDYSSAYPAPGLRHRYNGGCVRDGDWWEGEEAPLPIIHPDYEIVPLSSWGDRIQRKSEPTK